jgi:GTP-binding protein
VGTRFLGHIERCGVLLHLVDGTEGDVAAAYRTVRGELDAYGHGLTDKEEIVALTKCDALDAAAIKKKLAALRKAAGRGRKVLAISAVAGTGMTEALRALRDRVREFRAAEQPKQEEAYAP